MEAISKKISLEPFYSRQKSVIPFVGMYDNMCPKCGKKHDGPITAETWTCEYCGSVNESELKKYYPNLNWGKIAYGVDFTKLASEPGAVNNYGNGIKMLGTMSFPELMREYHRAIEYKVKHNIGGPEMEDTEEIEKLRSIVAFVESKKVVDLPASPPDPCCDPCIKPSPVPARDMDSGNYYVPPTANLSVCLVQSSNIVGSYTFATKEWVAGKRYFAGDKVLYDGKTFRLKEFTDTNAIINSSDSNCHGQPSMPGVGFYTGHTLSDFENVNHEAYKGLSEELFEDCVVNNPSEVVDMGLIYAEMRSENDTTYFIRPSWGGYVVSYDNTTYFDVLRNPRVPEAGFKTYGEYETEHWEIVDDVVSYGSYEVTDGCGEDTHIPGAHQERNIGFGEIEISGLRWESKLVNFRRNTKSMTFDGVELPGKFVSSGSVVLDLQYVVGTIKNIDTTGDKVLGDVLKEIRLENDNGQVIILTADYTAEHQPSLDDFAGVVTTWLEQRGYITFEYYVGAELARQNPADRESEYIYSGGEKNICYVDKYRFIVKQDTKDMDVDGQRIPKTFTFIDIDYNASMSNVTYEDINYYQDRVIMSDVTVKTQSLTEGGGPASPNFQNTDYFMEDYQLGVAFVANNNTNVYIDRGTATAFERHMRLSEVDTMQDLENIGNNMFKLKA